MAPGPTGEHQWVQENIVEQMRPFVRSRRLGIVIDAPWDVVVEREPLRTRQPDVLFLSVERGGITRKSQLRDMARLEIPPNLIVEVLSDSDRWAALEGKLTDYRNIGVTEAWLVDPEDETVRVLLLSSEGDTEVGVFGVGEEVRSLMLPDLHLAVGDIFADE